VRLDASKSPRFAAAARPTRGFDARRNTQHEIYRCSHRPRGRFSLATNRNLLEWTAPDGIERARLRSL